MPPRVLAAVGDFEGWRQCKEPARRIPQRLSGSGGQSLRGVRSSPDGPRLPAGRQARRLDYESLERRVAEKGPEDHDPPQFIDVSARVAPVSESGCVVEVEDPAG